MVSDRGALNAAQDGVYIADADRSWIGMAGLGDLPRRLGELGFSQAEFSQPSPSSCPFGSGSSQAGPWIRDRPTNLDLPSV